MDQLSPELAATTRERNREVPIWIVTRHGDGYEARQHTMSATGGEWMGEALAATLLEELCG